MKKAISVEEFLERWCDHPCRNEMKADLEEISKHLWKAEYDAHCATVNAHAEMMTRAKKYAKDYWDDDFMGETQEQCDKSFEESWRREVVLWP